ncbi:MAG: calcium-binding protein [Pseudomonadota bacterium]
MTNLLLQYAQLVSRGYLRDRTAQNEPFIPLGWSLVPRREILDGGGATEQETGIFPSGFQAGAYTNGQEIVIVYGGTSGTDVISNENALNDWKNNVLLFAGLPGPQLLDAVRFYLEVKAYNGTALPIRFAGHSLGGGLASLMTAFFGDPTTGWGTSTTFAVAPFESAINVDVVRRVADYIDSLGVQYAADAQALRQLIVLDETSSEPAYKLDSAVLAEREKMVDNHSIEGEILSRLRTEGFTFANPVGQLISLGNTEATEFDRHAISLHLAALGSESFKEASIKLPSLLRLMLDEVLYARDLRRDQQLDFLERLVRYQFAYEEPGLEASTALLDRFGADMQKLAPSVAGDTASIRDAVIAAGIEFYNFVDPGVLEPFFDQVSGGVLFDVRNIALNGAQSRAQPRLWASARDYIEQTAGGNALSGTALNAAPVWAVQVDDEKLEFTGSDANEIMLGGNEADSLFGGGGNDVLVGGRGSDDIGGGQGDDHLVGGSGFDTYFYATGDGRDTIYEDDDLLGRIKLGEAILTGGATWLRPNTWADGDLGLTYTFLGRSTWGDGGQLRISGDGLGGAGNVIIVENFRLPTAEQADGALSLSFARQAKIEVRDATAVNPWMTDLGHEAPTDPATALAEGQGKTVSVFLNTAAAEGEAIRLSLNGGDTTAFGIVTGDRFLPFAGGDLEIALAQGQTQLTFALQSVGDVDADATLSLTATFLEADPGSGATPASHSLSIEFDAIDEGFATVPETTRTILGDLAPIDFDPAADGVQRQADDLGNVITDPGQAQPGRDDTLYDSAGNDLIQSGGGDDTIIADRGGDDVIDAGDGDDELTLGEGGSWVTAGTGDDIVDARAGNDKIQGGDGQDLLAGDDGDDLIFGDVETALDEAMVRGEAQAASGLKGDWLDGGAGRDQLIGTAGNDALLGGGGADTLVGGGGNDILVGDDERSFVQRSWGVSREVIANGDATTYRYTFLNASVSTAADGDGDRLIGGAGEDWIFGGAGDDFADGGTDADVVFGDRGDDTLLGGSSNDVLVGDNSTDSLAAEFHGADFLDGGDGDDILEGNQGSDALFGGAGNDQLFGDGGDDFAGDDYLDGEDGDDILVGAAGSDTLYGGAGNDQLIGDNSDVAADKQGGDFLDGEEGDDVLIGGGGADTLYGGDGSDELYGEASDTPDTAQGDDFLDGGAGDDLLVGGGGADILYGGEGDDTLAGEASDTPGNLAGDDFLDGEAGEDVLMGGGGSDTLIGGDDDDQLFGDAEDVDVALRGDDYLDGGDGNDVLVGFRGRDTLIGGAGDDELIGDIGGDLAEGDDDYLDGGEGNDRLFGDAGNDQLFGGTGDDQLAGSFGDDQLFGGTGDDQLAGSFGDDLLDGGDGADRLEGGEDNDQLAGGLGDDILIGGLGDDLLDGGDGNDQLDGGLGTDRLAGGDGDDTYVYSLGSGAKFLSDSSGTDSLYLLGGITLNSVKLGLGSLLITTQAPGDEIHIEGFDPNDAAGSSPIERFVFSDGASYTAAELIADARQVGMSVGALNPTRTGEKRVLVCPQRLHKPEDQCRTVV